MIIRNKGQFEKLSFIYIAVANFVDSSNQFQPSVILDPLLLMSRENPDVIPPFIHLLLILNNP